MAYQFIDRLKGKETKNLLSLTAIQGSNAVLPLIIFPYLFQVLGQKAFSQLVITESVIMIVYAFTLYSFEINGVSNIVKFNEEGDSCGISRLFSRVLLIRLIILSLLMLAVVVLSLLFYERYFYLLLGWGLFPLGYILQSSYLYLGMERNFPLAIFVLLGRAICVLLVFLCIQSEDDLLHVPLIIGGSFLLGGVMSFIYLLMKLKLRLNGVSFNEVKSEIRKGVEIFVGNASVLLFRDLNVLILGSVSGDPIVISCYSITEKVVKSLQAVIRPLNQFFFPKGVRLLVPFKRPTIQTLKALWQVTFVQVSILLILVVATVIVFVFFKGYLAEFVDFKKFDIIITMFSIMSVSILFGVLNFMYGSLGLNHLNSKKYFATIIIVTGIISLVFTNILVRLYGGYGASVGFVFSETLLFIFIIRKYLTTEVEFNYSMK